jgi:ATP-dependent Lon protease
VRNLERELSTLIRKAVKEMILSKKEFVKASADNLADYLGVPRYRYGEVEDHDQVGIVTGLAWTDMGGELLTIEAALMQGKGRMTVTGNLRDVMKESISAAASYVRSRAVTFGIKPPLFDKRDIHVHVPEGATPKDGPSAGVGEVELVVADHLLRIGDSLTLGLRALCRFRSPCGGALAFLRSAIRTHHRRLSTKHAFRQRPAS